MGTPNNQTAIKAAFLSWGDELRRTALTLMWVLLLPAAVASRAVMAGESQQAAGPTWRIELKRENVERGTEDESTKTTLRLERFFTGPVRLLRLDVPLPDRKSDFAGDPFDPGLGDVKVRAGFRAARSGIYSFPSFVELTFPTADPDTLGGRTHVINLGASVVRPVTLPVGDPASHRTTLEFQIQQVNSFARDPDGKNIANTKFEITLYDVWRGRYSSKIKLKPSIDWVRDGDTGAVAEIEGGVFFARDWRAWLLLGHRVWGPQGIQSTYGTKVEMGIARTF